MRAAVTAVNLVMGGAYVAMGTIALHDLVTGWRNQGYSRFGAGLVAIAFTCGPHHLTHAVHVGLENHPSSGLELTTVLVGLPPGLLWLSLRVEALTGRRGDRFIAGTPGWLAAVPTVAGFYVACVLAVGVGLAHGGLEASPVAVLGIGAAGVYAAIAWVMARTQLRNRTAVGGWSLSGFSLAATFATCGVTHLGVALEVMAQRSHGDSHLLLIDAATLVAGLYLLTVVHRLTRDLLEDWNTVSGAAPAVP